MEDFELVSVGQYWDVLACSESFLITHEFFDVFFFVEENDTQHGHCLLDLYSFEHIRDHELEELFVAEEFCLLVFQRITLDDLYVSEEHLLSDGVVGVGEAELSEQLEV